MKRVRAIGILLPFVCHIYQTFAASSDTLVKDPSNDNSEACTCYLTSGIDPAYFQHHRFWDFRSISSDGGNDFTNPPTLLNKTDDLVNAPPTSSFLSTSDFVTNWSIQNWTADADTSSPVSRVNSAQNIYISRNSTSGSESATYLTLRASRLDDFMSIAELESNQKNLLHSSIRARMRFIPNNLLSSSPTLGSSNDTTLNSSHPVSAGAVAGLFTYYSSTAESDIEILTRDPTDMIRYSNQPDYDAHTDSAIPGASTQSTLPPPKAYTDWIDHRIDWLDGVSRWYVDDELVLEKQMNVPKEASGLILNLWGDGGEWSGNMTVGSEVVLGVEWIELVFNTSGKVEGPPQPKETGSSGPGGKDSGSGTSKRDVGPSAGLWKRKSQDKCKVACNVDGVKQVGFPEVAFNGTTSAASIVGSRADGKIVVLATVVILAVLWISGT
jgi:hypothetical protein